MISGYSQAIGAATRAAAATWYRPCAVATPAPVATRSPAAHVVRRARGESVEVIGALW